MRNHEFDLSDGIPWIGTKDRQYRMVCQVGKQKNAKAECDDHQHTDAYPNGNIPVFLKPIWKFYHELPR